VQVNQGSQTAEPSTQGDGDADYWQPSQHGGNEQMEQDNMLDEETAVSDSGLLFKTGGSSDRLWKTWFNNRRS